MTMTTMFTSDLPWSCSSSLSLNSVRSFAISHDILIRAPSLKMPCLPCARSHSSASALLFFLRSARACFCFSFCSGWFCILFGTFGCTFGMNIQGCAAALSPSPFFVQVAPLAPLCFQPCASLGVCPALSHRISAFLQARLQGSS